MEHDGDESAVLWREGNHRCELWMIDGVAELRVYVSDVLTYRETVQPSTRGLRRAAELRAAAQAEIDRSRDPSGS
jgi:hypothetical protein